MLLHRTINAQNLGGVLDVAVLPKQPLDNSDRFLVCFIEGRENSDKRPGQSDLDPRCS